MKISDLQDRVRRLSLSDSNPFNSAPEIMLAITEEVGEVAQEVALLERIGTKAGWQKEPSKERLSNEISDLINCIFTLANHYDINIEERYKKS